MLSEEEEKNVFVSEREEKKHPRRKYSSYYEVAHFVVSHCPVLFSAPCCLSRVFSCSHQHPILKHVQQHNMNNTLP
jgi:hypothetical protein